MKTSLIIALLFNCLIAVAQQQDTTKEKPVQYRRGIQLQEDYQSYDEKYSGKNLNEEKRSLFPLQSTGVWTELNPKVPRVDYLGINFINPDTGWAVGDLGALIKTTDGGSSWTVSQTNTTTTLLKVRSFNGQLVIASGFDGLILRSTDGGENFTQVTSGVTGDLWGLQMLNDTLGFACGNANSLAKTIDGGISWQRIFMPSYTSDYWWIDFLTESYGFIAANGKVLRTTDSGNNWEIIQAGDSQPLFSIDVIDSLHIAAAGYGGTGYGGKNIYSSDGGNTWVNGGTITFETVNDIKYVNTDTGYVVMNNVIGWKTTNRGQQWTGIGLGGEYEMQFFKEDNIGYSAGSELRIYKTENGYENWQRLIKNDNFSDVFFVNEQKGFAISWSGISSPSGLYKTIDGGIHWEKVSEAPDGVDLLFLDSLTGFIGASNSIYKTTDGGENWYTTNGTTGAGKIFFINETTGWAVHSTSIYKTTDGGENWVAQMTMQSDSYTSIFFIDSLNGWATSRYVWQTTDGGVNWIEDTSVPTFFLLDVFFKDYLNGFILSSNKFYSTTDGGTNWVLNPNLTGFSVAGKFSYYSDSTIFIIGYKTFRSIDGGENWEEILELDGKKITGLSLLNPGSGYAVGELGLILNYYDDSIPVELSSFSGSYISNNIELKWTTETELNNSGFNVLRSTDLTNWETIGFVPGRGTTTLKGLYTFYDHNLIGNHLFYKLEQIDFDGSYSFSEIIEVEIKINNYSLAQNYPNPANPKTRITFSIPDNTIVKLNLYSITGELIKELVNEEKEKGIYQVDIDLSKYTSGMYFYRMTTNSGYTATKKLIILK